MPINYGASIEIRDNRKHPWFWVQSHIWKELDRAEKVVYGTLALFANNGTQESFPSIETVAKDSDCSSRQVYRSLKILEKKKIISIERDLGKPNRYTLLDYP
jgi:predicted transcriptional regulator